MEERRQGIQLSRGKKEHIKRTLGLPFIRRLNRHGRQRQSEYSSRPDAVKKKRQWKPCRYISRARKALVRLSCSVALQALTLFDSVADLSNAIIILLLHYITLSPSLFL